MRVLLFAYLLIGFSGFSQLYEPENELLWEVSGNGLKEKSYLFGTFHNNHKDLFRFPDTLYYALNKAKTIALETDLFSLFKKVDVRESDVNLQFDMYGDPYTTTDKATSTVYGNEDGMPQFLDAYFQQYCLNAGKGFIPLESIADQFELLTDHIQVSNKQFIDNAVNDFTNERLVELYLKGDLLALDKFMRVNMSIQNNLQNNLYEEVITKRNVKMAVKLDSILKTKTSFFCAVGAGHLGSTGGILNLLRSKGYKIRLVKWTHSETPCYDEKMVRSAMEFIYKDESSGLIAKFPGKPIVLNESDNSTRVIYRELGQGNTYEISIMPIDETISPEEIASIYIATPPNTDIRKIIMDDGDTVYEGLSNTYPEGLNFVQIQFGAKHFAIIKTYGGNKFMHSNRPNQFFSKVWFE